jgi:hypothetical protein
VLVPIFIITGRATYQAVSHHQLVIAEVQVRCLGSPYGVCGGQIASAQFLSEHFDVFPASYRPTDAPYSLSSPDTQKAHNTPWRPCSALLQLLCPLQQIGLQRTQLAWQQTFTSRTTHTSVCHKHSVQNIYIRYCSTRIFTHACTARFSHWNTCNPVEILQSIMIL